MSAVITARNLTKRFTNTTAVDNVSFEIPAGRIVGLIGPNGSGKTTALKAILGLTTYEGQLNVLGFVSMGFFLCDCVCAVMLLAANNNINNDGNIFLSMGFYI